MLTLDKIYHAAHILKDVIRETDLIYSPTLVPGCELYLKPENLQITGSFKLRGAFYKVTCLSDAEKAKGVVACSAGNHAQGVAKAAKENNIDAIIFLPSTAPLSKIEATRRYGAEIRLIDGVYDDAYKAALDYQKETGATFIHPFDDYDVIAGQGTIGLELIEQMRDMEAVIVPVGGGGLISGIAFAIKKLNPNCKVYGVQAEGAKSMSESLAKSKRSELQRVSTFADGIAVKSPGAITYQMCSEYVDGITTVTDDEIAAALLSLMEKQKLVSEGAGAVAVAAAMYGKVPVAGKKTCAIVSGGNIDVNILSKVINRGLIMAGRHTELVIELIDKPGQLKDISAIIADSGANVTKVTHNHAGENTDINGCFLEISMETRDRAHLLEIKDSIKKAGFKIR